MNKFLTSLIFVGLFLMAAGCSDGVKENPGETVNYNDSGDSGDTGDTGDSGDTGDAEGADVKADNEEPDDDCSSYGMTDCVDSWFGDSKCFDEKNYVYCEEIHEECNSGSRDVYGECDAGSVCGECSGRVECVDETVFNERKTEYEKLKGSWTEIERWECGAESAAAVDEDKKLKIVFGEFKYGDLFYEILNKSDEVKWSSEFCFIDINYDSSGQWKPEYSFNEAGQLLIENVDKLDTGTNTLDDEIEGFCKFVFEKSQNPQVF